MERKLKAVLAVILTLAFVMLSPYSIQFERGTCAPGTARQGNTTREHLSAAAANQTLEGDYIVSETEVTRIARTSIIIEFFILAAFSLRICRERVLLAYLHFRRLPLARFLCELSILLKKDGKKRMPAFL